MTNFKNGELVAYHSHPYQNGKTNIKITAYADYTAPILNIIEVKPGKHDTETGKDLGKSVHCIYYNSKVGKLETKWINNNLLKSLEFSIIDNPFLEQISFIEDEDGEKKPIKKIESLLQANYLNKKVCLKSMPLELVKVKANRSYEKDKFIETNHLEFLPPIMSIIGFRFPDEKKRYCEETGKLKIEVKCKWYNSATKSFSEEFIPYQVLFIVKETYEISGTDLVADIQKTIESNSLIIAKNKKPFKLEEIKPEINITNTLLEPSEVYFNHYHYVLQSLDYIVQQKRHDKISQPSSIKTNNEIFGATFPDYKNGYRKKVADCTFSPKNYYLIQYNDLSDRKTKRIIRVATTTVYIKNIQKFIDDYQLEWENYSEVEFVNFNKSITNEITIHLEGHSIKNNKINLKKAIEDENLDFFIVANCLLREGKIRHFRLTGIETVREIIDGKSLFEE